jgi:outer membrane protein assembly factor BamB
MTQSPNTTETPDDQPLAEKDERAQQIIDKLKPAHDPQFRWKWGIAILFAGTIAETAVWNIYSPDRTYQVMWSMPAVSSTLFLLFLWWTFWSGLTWASRGFGLGAVVVSLGAFMAVFRFDGFDGDMWPRFSRRSSLTAEEKLEQFLAKSDEQPKPQVSKAAPQQPDNQPTPDIAAKDERRQLTASEFDWTGFRGPNRDGIVKARYKFDWSVPLKEKWRHPVGRGWSSFAIVDGFAFTQEQREQGESVVCYHVETGATMWRHSDPVRFEEAMGGVGPRATPTFSEGHLYTLGATGVLNCLNAVNGDLVWQRNVLDDAKVQNIPWAMAGSPLVVGELVIANPGGEDGNGVIAYNKMTGKRAWSAGNDRTSYAAPTLRSVLGEDQVVIFDGVGIAGHAIKNGNELWKVEWSNDPQVNAAQPIIVESDLLFVGSGYGRGSGLIQLKKSGDKITSKVKWSSPRFKLKFNAAIRQGDYAYGLDEGVLACINMRDGTRKWKRGRYGYGQLLKVDDVLVIQAEHGDIAFVRASPDKFQELNRVTALTSKSWNHPVIWENLLLVRNAQECICYEIAGEKIAASK